MRISRQQYHSSLLHFEICWVFISRLMQNSNAYLHKCEHFQIFFNNTVVNYIVKCLKLKNYFPHWRFVYNYIYKFGRYFLFIKQVLYCIRNTLQTKLFDRNKEGLTFFLYVIWKQMKIEYNEGYNQYKSMTRNPQIYLNL